MATLFLQAAGQAAGGVFGGSLGATLGRAAGAIAGRLVDQALISHLAPARRVEGPRLKELDVQASSEGAPVPRLYGRARLAGQVIWATRFEEEVLTSTQSSGGKFGGGAKTVTTAYSYYANFAVGLCEGPITRIGRIWADGKPIDAAGLNFRVYPGDEDQLPDPLIEAKEGAGNAPAYRGLAYVVFEHLALEAFGNRLPQLSFEVLRAVDGLEQRITAVTIMPGTTEFGYDTTVVTRNEGVGKTAPENRHTGSDASDWTASLDDLTATCPNLSSVSLVVAWFGDDLRCGTCAIRPGVDSADKATTGRTWEVNGIARAAAHLVSEVDGRAAFGGTPCDASVLAAIADLKARGKEILFHPFVMMDVPAANGLPDPWGGSEQAVYPWRGRLTCDPAPGEPGTPDKTAAAATQVSTFFGAAAPGDFATGSETVTYGGPAEWSYRRMILHYAHLCAMAGGIDAFLLGSELVNLTTVRDSAEHYPAVDELVALAADVRAILGPGTRISYAANWSEYFGHQPQDGTGDVFFHLDPLWADGEIDFIGVNNYMPLSDWRDGDGHLDAQAGAQSIYDLDYLRGNVAGGEGFDWYYAGDADRDAQVRTPITDGAHGKPWVFRNKDLKSWWQNQHFDRPGGVESVSPTGWVPESKPIWFTEAGCPAIDKGTNQPNVFCDPKSAESAVPYFSTGVRDDLAQRAYIDALTSYWTPGDPAHDPNDNPMSAVYGAAMVDARRIHLWSWDARPFPQFPYLPSVWSDGPNWERGHWLNGRVGSVAVDQLISEIVEDYGFTDHAVEPLYGIADGYVIDRPMSARDALEPLSLAFFFDGVESDGAIAFRARSRAAATDFDPDGMVHDGEGGPYRMTRAQESELPGVAGLTYVDSVADYRVAAVASRRLFGQSRREAHAQLPVVTNHSAAQTIADIWLQDVWAGREKIDFALPPSALALEPGDAVVVTKAGVSCEFSIDEIADGTARQARGRALARSVYKVAGAAPRDAEVATPAIFGTPFLELLDVPAVKLGDDPVLGAAVAFADPWPGGVPLYRSRSGGSFELAGVVDTAGVIGETLTALSPGPAGRWDQANSLDVLAYGGTLNAADPSDVLGGSNLAAVRNENGAWELLQFASAELIAADTYRLSGLLRGLAGTEDAMLAVTSAQSRFVLLNGAVTKLDLSAEDLGIPFTWRYGPASQDVSGPAFTETVASLSDRALRPLSPVHIRGTWNGTGLELAWMRRTRIGGDSWDQIEVPLGEDSEAYEIDILDNGTVLRTLTSQLPSATYTEAMQTADFGAAPATLEIDIYQISETRGRGVAGHALLTL